MVELLCHVVQRPQIQATGSTAQCWFTALSLLVVKPGVLHKLIYIFPLVGEKVSDLLLVVERHSQLGDLVTT